MRYLYLFSGFNRAFESFDLVNFCHGDPMNKQTQGGCLTKVTKPVWCILHWKRQQQQADSLYFSSCVDGTARTVRELRASAFDAPPTWQDRQILGVQSLTCSVDCNGSMH